MKKICELDTRDMLMIIKHDENEDMLRMFYRFDNETFSVVNLKGDILLSRKINGEESYYNVELSYIQVSDMLYIWRVINNELILIAELIFSRKNNQITSLLAYINKDELKRIKSNVVMEVVW